MKNITLCFWEICSKENKMTIIFWLVLIAILLSAYTVVKCPSNFWLYIIMSVGIGFCMGNGPSFWSILLIVVGLCGIFINMMEFYQKNKIKTDNKQENIPNFFEQTKGICCFCGEQAGLFKTYHKECLEAYKEGKNRFLELSAQFLLDDMKLENFDTLIQDIQKNNYIKSKEMKLLEIELLKKTVDISLEDNTIGEVFEKNILKYVNHFELNPNTDIPEIWEKACKGVTIRKLTQGILPQQMKISDNLPFNLQKNEKIIWCFKDVEQCQYKNKTEYQGSSMGYSFRVAKGFYIRQSAFKGHPIHYKSLETVDRGLVLLTDRNLYFGGQYNIFKIPYNKILAICPYDDGVVIQKDASTAKPDIFMVNDVWYFYNLIYNLMHMEF